MRTVKKRGTDTSEREDEQSPRSANRSISGLHQAASRPKTLTITTPPQSFSTAPPQPFSFIEELRLSDLEIGDERPTVAAPRFDDNLAPTLTREQFNALLPARLPSEFAEIDPSDILDLDDAEPHASEHDDRTIERYVPPSVEDLDYDTDMTTDMPSEWIDHLAASASARPSDQPPSLRPTLESNRALQVLQAPLPKLPITSMVVPTMPLPTLAMPRATHNPILPTPSSFALPPPSSLSPLTMQRQPQMQLRSDPIPWNPAPPSSSRSRYEASKLPLFLVCAAFVSMVLLMVVLRIVLTSH